MKKRLDYQPPILARCLACDRHGPPGGKFYVWAIKDLFPIRLLGYLMTPNGPKRIFEDQFLCPDHYAYIVGGNNDKERN